MLLVAHRGDVANEPENTIAAFRSAVDGGADGIEMDVQRSASGTWWVIHDRTVERTTDGEGAIAVLRDVDLEQLLITGGVGYDADKHRNAYGVPSLTSVLDELEDFHGRLYLHVKATDLDSFRHIGDLVSARGLASRTAVIAEEPDQLAAIKAVDRRIRTLLLHDSLGFPEDAPSVDAWLTSRHRITRADLVAWRPYDVEVFVDSRLAGTDESGSLEKAHRWNVAAFFTNDLRGMRDVLERLERQEP